MVGAEAIRLVHAALDAGITLYDTADVYGGGESERLLGRALKDRHDRCVLATKLRHGPVQPGASRKSIRVGLDASLKRLGADYVDLLQMHAPDPATPLHETLDALQDCVRQGKVLSFGLCNVSAWQLADGQHLAWRRQPGIASVQVPISLVQRAALKDLSPAARRFDVGLLAASPLGRGVLGGRYAIDRPPPAGHALLSGKGVGLWDDAGRRCADLVRAVAVEAGLTPAQASLSALLSQPVISAVVVGMHSQHDLLECCAAGGDVLTAEHARRLIVI